MTDKKNITWVKCDWFREEDDEEDEDDDSYYDDSPSVPKMIGFGPSVVVTSFGPVNECDTMNPVFDTDFYQGHTNFNLSKKVLEGINKVEGVEFLKVMSRYRFIIGIGMMFNFKDVKDNVEKSMGIKTEITKIESPELTEESEQSLEYIVNEIVSQIPIDKKWLAYIFPNGEHIIKIANNDMEYTTIFDKFSILAKESYGIIIGSEDCPLI